MTRVEPEWAMVTVLFADIPGFTSFADCATAVEQLNTFFGVVIPIVELHGDSYTSSRATGCARCSARLSHPRPRRVAARDRGDALPARGERPRPRAARRRRAERQVSARHRAPPASGRPMTGRRVAWSPAIAFMVLPRSRRVARPRGGPVELGRRDRQRHPCHAVLPRRLAHLCDDGSTEVATRERLLAAWDESPAQIERLGSRAHREQSSDHR